MTKEISISNLQMRTVWADFETDSQGFRELRIGASLDFGAWDLEFLLEKRLRHRIGEQLPRARQNEIAV